MVQAPPDDDGPIEDVSDDESSGPPPLVTPSDSDNGNNVCPSSSTDSSDDDDVPVCDTVAMEVIARAIAAGRLMRGNWQAVPLSVAVLLFPDLVRQVLHERLLNVLHSEHSSC